MTEWSLQELLAGLHDDIERRLETVRKTLGHPGTKGDASEAVWIELFENYLPRRYQAEKAHVVDSSGEFSQQMDVVIFDRQYSPFIFNYQDQIIVPAESVYAVFEAKQSINAAQVQYAQNKVASVRQLHRTSLAVPYVEGTYKPKPLPPIFGGILTFGSDWNPPLGEPMLNALGSGKPESRLDIGCVAAHGYFEWSDDRNEHTVHQGGKPATAFLLKLISMLQTSGTVPMIDIQAYARWLSS